MHVCWSNRKHRKQGSLCVLSLSRPELEPLLIPDEPGSELVLGDGPVPLNKLKLTSQSTTEYASFLASSRVFLAGKGALLMGSGDGASSDSSLNFKPVWAAIAQPGSDLVVLERAPLPSDTVPPRELFHLKMDQIGLVVSETERSMSRSTISSRRAMQLLRIRLREPRLPGLPASLSLRLDDSRVCSRFMAAFRGDYEAARSRAQPSDQLSYEAYRLVLMAPESLAIRCGAGADSVEARVSRAVELSEITLSSVRGVQPAGDRSLEVFQAFGTQCMPFAWPSAAAVDTAAHARAAYSAWRKLCAARTTSSGGASSARRGTIGGESESEAGDESKRRGSTAATKAKK